MNREARPTALPEAPLLVTRFLDIRRGEWRLALPAFAALFLTVAAHTTLETARDAIFLAKLPAKDLNVVYVVLAGITLVTTFLSAKLTVAVGRRNALVASLLLVAVGAFAFYFVALSPKGALALYLFSGVEGAMLAPQFWLLADDLFTVAQARRLFNSITSGGVAGGVAGAALAAVIARGMPVTDILPVTAGLFLLSAFAVTMLRADVSDEPRASVLLENVASTSKEPSGSPFKDNPFLVRIAALVCLSTAAVLVVDYLFKSAAARVVPAASLGFFFARYYAVMNAVSLVVQVLVAGRLVRRLGVIGAAAITPLLLFGTGLAAALGQGVFVLVLCLKTCDGALRYSLNRVATELLYMPVPAAARQKAKGFIDSALSRIVQAITAIALYLLTMRALATPHLLAAIVVVLCGGWAAVSLTLRAPYLDLFRRALNAGGITSNLEVHELDMTSAEALVEAMANPDPVTVVAAMDVLDEHNRSALIPALILYHDAPTVLTRALALFSAGKRTDWVPLGERLLNHADDAVAAAAVRALAKAGRFEALEGRIDHPSPRLEAYAAFYRAQHDGAADLLQHPLIAAVMKADGDRGRKERRALITAVSDSPSAGSENLLLALAELPHQDDADVVIGELARAIAALKSPRFIPVCLQRLAKRGGRDAIRDALVAIGAPALEALDALLQNEDSDRRLRLHAPRSISRFGTQQAADLLVAQLLREKHGMVRYKILRALGQLVAREDVKVDLDIIERETTRNVEEFLRLLSFRVALAGRSPRGTRETDEAKLVLDGLLEDKLRQSMERAFRLLQIAHRHEDIESVHEAARSSDKAARANAGEFLDVLLGRRDEERLRRMLRIVVDDASDARRVQAANGEVAGLAHSYVDALTKLLADKDEVVVALAAQHALALDDAGLKQAVAQAEARSPQMRATSELLFGRPLGSEVPAHG